MLVAFGHFEVVISAVAFASGIIFVTKLTARHLAIEATAANLVSGLALAAILWIRHKPTEKSCRLDGFDSIFASTSLLRCFT